MTLHKVVQLSYTPELNPVERLFRDLRRALEGRTEPALPAKQAALEPILNAWQAKSGAGEASARLVLYPGHSGSPIHR